MEIEKNEQNKSSGEEIPTTLVVVKDEDSFDASKLKKYIINEYVAISHMTGVFKIQSPSRNEVAMVEFLKRKLNNIEGVFYEIDTKGNILVSKGVIGAGEYYPCIVAHMDKVHGMKENYRISKGTLKGTTTDVLYAESYDKVSKKFTRCGGVGDRQSCLLIQ